MSVTSSISNTSASKQVFLAGYELAADAEEAVRRAIGGTDGMVITAKGSLLASALVALGVTAGGIARWW